MKNLLNFFALAAIATRKFLENDYSFQLIFSSQSLHLLLVIHVRKMRFTTHVEALVKQLVKIPTWMVFCALKFVSKAVSAKTDLLGMSSRIVFQEIHAVRNFKEKLKFWLKLKPFQIRAIKMKNTWNAAVHANQLAKLQNLNHVHLSANLDVSVNKVCWGMQKVYA